MSDKDQEFGFLAWVCPASANVTWAGSLVWGNGSKTQTENFYPLPQVTWKK